MAVILTLTCVGSRRPALSQETAADKAKTDEATLLKIEDLSKGWVFCSAENGSNGEASWKTQKLPGETEFSLVCLGKPFGYVRTVEIYENYEFGLEWKYPADPNGNSGILIHTTEPDKVWPKSIQVQLHRPKAGSIFPSSGATTDNTVDVKDLSRPVNEWNTCVIACRDGKVLVTINDKKAGEVTGCMPSKGFICLQSEGSEIHFRRLWIRKAKPTE